MIWAAEHYELMSIRARKAAEEAVTLNERIRHLETALRYAKLACAERKRPNLHEFTSSRP